MIRPRRRHLLLIAISALAISLPALVADTRPACVRAADWVAAHETSLPTTWQGIGAYPDPYSRTIFEKLPPAARAEIWRSRLDDLLASSRLNVSQSDVVRSLRAEVGSELWDGRRQLSQQKIEAARAVFTDDEVRTYFMRLGPPEGNITIGTASIILRDYLSRAAAVLALPSCNCATDADCSWNPSSPNYCWEGGYPCACTTHSQTCGFMWCQWCIGRCVNSCL